jgi:N-methylhydantoinase A
MGPDGELDPLDLNTLPDLDAEAVAVCLLHAYRDPAHERAVAEELRRRLPGAHVVASHEVAPEFREYERASTTAADAYLGPVVARYLHALADAAATEGLPEPLVMRSSGGVATPDEAAAHPATILVSGPAAGVVGAARLAALAGIKDAIAFDMGGTSTDVCLIAGGHAERSSERTVAGLPIRLPTVDLHTVGAGGGSLVWIDARRAARPGRRRRRGTRARRVTDVAGRQGTVTDANLLLGRLPPRLAGGRARPRGCRTRARRNRPCCGRGRGQREMLRAWSRLGRARARSGGLRPRGVRRCGTVACVRAGRRARIRSALSPRPGVLSALGLVASEERRDAVRSYLVPLADAGELPAEGEADLRYAGQSFELTLPLQEDLEEVFHRVHEEQYGFAEKDRVVELVAVRTADIRKDEISTTHRPDTFVWVALPAHLLDSPGGQG